MKDLIKGFIFGLILVSLCACGKKDETKTIVTQSKAVQSVWTTTYNAWVLDFSDFQPQSHFTLHESYSNDGGACASDAVVTWPQDQDAGTLTLSNTQTVNNQPGMVQCSQFDGTWTYQFLSDSTLVLCGSNGNCILFH